MEKHIFLTETNFNKLKIEIEKIRKKEPNSKIIFFGNNDEINRQVLEKAKIDLILISLSKRKDFSKQRNSGLNTVLVNIAKKNKIIIGIDLDELDFNNKKEEGKFILSKLSQNKEKSEILARIIQNINLCKKKKVQMKFISRKKTENLFVLKSLGLSLGMPTWMTKNL
jgi:hypothetical protein